MIMIMIAGRIMRLARVPVCLGTTREAELVAVLGVDGVHVGVSGTATLWGQGGRRGRGQNGMGDGTG